MKERERKFSTKYQVVRKAQVKENLKGIQPVPQSIPTTITTVCVCVSVLKSVVLFGCLIRIVCLAGLRTETRALCVLGKPY